MTIKNKYSLAVIFAFLIFSLCVVFNLDEWKSCKLLHWDSAGYQTYLPAVFIYDDIENMKFFDHIDSIYKPSGDHKRYALLKNDLTQKTCNKYTYGVALFQAPLFFVAQFYTKYISNSYPCDGFSPPFQLAVSFSTLLFGLWALLLLRKFLSNFFDDKWTAITIAILSLGTNFFHYYVKEQGFAHIYLFFLTTAVLYLTHSWYNFATIKKSILLGICLGAVILIRPANGIIVFIPLLWKGYNINKIAYWKKEYLKILVVIIFSLLIIFPQMLLWKHLTNSWIYYSYQTEKFNFTKPHILEGLFSYRKGWFVYTPLALLGFLGLIFIAKKNELRFYVSLMLLFFCISFYITFSWEAWHYSGSFGCRPMVDFLPLLAIPTTSFIEYVFTRTKFLLRLFFSAALVFLIFLNIFQTYQYHKAIIHWANMNKVYFWRVFLKTSTTEEDRALIEW